MEEKNILGNSKFTKKIILLCAVSIAIAAIFLFTKENNKDSNMSVGQLSNITANEIGNIEILKEKDIIDANSILRVSLMLDNSYIYDGYMMDLGEDGILSVSLHKSKSSSTDKIDYIDIPMDIINQATNKKIEKIVIINEQLEEIKEVKL